jgi:thiol-disulfide isomerase/thioredoxin
MQALSLAFLKLCPDSLEPYDLLYRTSGPALAEPAAHLRRLLPGRTDAAAIRVWPRLWNLEFKVRPASEHDTLRRQIRDDLAALRPVAENEYVLLDTLLQGAKLTGDAELVREIESRQRGLLPVRVKVRDRYREWEEKNPYPKPGSALSDIQLFRRNKLAMLEQLLGDDPLNFWFLRERLSLLAQDDETPAQLLATAGQSVLEAAVPLEEAWRTTPPALIVATDWARRGVNRPQLAGLVDKGLAHQARIERNDLGTDLLDAKLIASEMKEGVMRNRIASFEIAADVSIRLGEFDKARRALLVMADVVKTGRDDLAAFRDLPPDRNDRYRMSLESQSRLWEFSLFLQNAELAKAENRKQDALAYYASALRTAHRINPNFGRNRILPDASGLWKELGGTSEGWQQWLDQSAPPIDSPKAEISKAVAAWTKSERPFPAFRVPDLDGRNRTLDDLKGAITFVNVWATWCEPCRAELPALQKLHDRLRESGAARVITLNTDLSTGLVGPFVAEHNYSFPVWLAQPLFDELRPMGGIPVNWIIDRDGVIRWENIGFAGGKHDEWIEAMLARLQEVR